MNNPHVHPVIAAALQGFAPPAFNTADSRAERRERYVWDAISEQDARDDERASRYYAPGDPDAPEGD